MRSISFCIRICLAPGFLDFHCHGFAERLKGARSGRGARRDRNRRWTDSRFPPRRRINSARVMPLSRSAR
jgi:hypothetical protein